MKQIGISSAPNAEKIDVRLSRRALFNPFRWRKGPNITRLETAFAQKFGGVGAISFESGRVGLWAILRALEIDKGDEVLIQAFTCVVVPDAILWAGATPVYVDIGEDYNATAELIERQITSRTRVIVVQHTFGIPSQVDKIMEVARKHKLVVIEDCAHTVGGVYKKGLLGSWAPISFFSFGQEKAISSTRGGIVVTKDGQFLGKLRQVQGQLPYPSRWAIVQRLLHPILWSIIRPTYYFWLGKAILFFALKTRVITYIVTPQELHAGKPPYFPSRLANAQARIALSQLERVEKFNKKRTELAVLYHWHLGKIMGIKVCDDLTSPLLRFPLRLGDPEGLWEFARKRHIILESWYDNPVFPKGTSLAKVGYVKGMAPNAEKLGREMINLPLSPTMTQADGERVMRAVKEFLKKYES